jgi:hypothetical protein
LSGTPEGDQLDATLHGSKMEPWKTELISADLRETGNAKVAMNRASLKKVSVIFGFYSETGDPTIRKPT